MIDNRTKSIPTSSSEVGIYYVYISQGNKDNGVYIVSDFSLPITVTKIAELYIGDSTKANLDGGNTFTGNQIINGDIIIQDITANNFLGNASSATKLKTFVNINGVAFDGSSNITIYDTTKEATISVGTVSQYFRGDKTWQTLNKIVVGLSNVDNTADANKNVLSATKLTIPRTINGVTFDGSENIVINAIDITPRIPISYMGIANGVATLDNNGIIPITQLPSYVDDVIEVANYESLPTIGERGKIYVTTNNNKTYRWSGSVYIYITSGAVDSVNGYTGVVILTKSDFILGNVDNTSDANKPVSIATQSALDLKQNLLSLGNFTSTTPGITISNGNGAVIGSGITFNITTAGTTTGGLITSGHWNNFNNKWDSNNHPITTSGYGLPDYPTTLPASDVYLWAKESTKPTYSYSEITSKPTLLSQFTNDLENYGSFVIGTPWTSYGYLTGITKAQVEAVLTGLITTHTHNYLSSFTETDPIFTAWNKSTGISITKSQVSDFPTSLSQFTNNLGNYGGWITGINSSMVTTALGYTPWYSGNHPTTISGYGITDIPTYNGTNFILNQNSSAQSANMWISGQVKSGSLVSYGHLSINSINDANIYLANTSTNGKNWQFTSESDGRLSINNYGVVTALQFLTSGAATFSSTVNATQLQSTVATGTAPFTVNSSTMVSNLNSQYLGGISNNNLIKTRQGQITDLNDMSNYSSSTFYVVPGGTGLPPLEYANILHINETIGWTSQLAFALDNNIYYRSQGSTDLTGISWRKLYHNGNLTNTLSTNYLPKWNGSSMVNSLISDDTNSIIIHGAPSSAAATIFSNGQGAAKQYKFIGQIDGISNTGFSLKDITNGVISWYVDGNNNFIIPSTTKSTSPTTGALVVNGGIGASGINTRVTSNSDNKPSGYPVNGGLNILSTNSLYGLFTGVSDSGDVWAQVGRNDGGTDLYSLRLQPNGGNIEIGYSADQGYKLAVNGSGYFNGTVTASNFILSSDRTLKTNIEPIIKDYSKLNLVSFNFKDNLNELRFGTIAQDLLSGGFSEFVTGDRDGEYKVKYIDLLIAKLASAESRIKQLEDKLYGSTKY